MDLPYSHGTHIGAIIAYFFTIFENPNHNWILLVTLFTIFLHVVFSLICPYRFRAQDPSTSYEDLVQFIESGTGRSNVQGLHVYDDNEEY